MSQETLGTAPDLEVFVPKNREEEYLATHHIERRTLPNGITIIGAPRMVEDMAWADIHFTFPSGSYHDPSGKEGIHHLFEHLIMNPVGEAPEGVDLERNASTSANEIDVYLRGTANPNVREYAVWPMLRHVANAIKSPLEGIEDLEGEIKREVKVVKREMLDTREYNHEVGRVVNSIIFDPTNPCLTDGLGTPQSLDGITPQDIEELANRVFIPDGLSISLYTQGGPTNCRTLADEIESLMIDYPRADVKSTPVDKKLYQKLNPNFNQGRTYANHLERNGQLRIVLPWIFKGEQFSVERYAFERFMDIVNHRLTMYTRRKGTSYTAGATFTDYPDFDLATLEIIMSTQPEISGKLTAEIYPEIREEVFGKIGEAELASMNRREQLTQLAVPVTIENRLEFLQSGIKNFGRILDVDAVKDVYSRITTAHLRDWRDRFLSEDPAFILVGDLKGPRRPR